MRSKINWILGSLIALLGGCRAPQKTIQQEVVTLYGIPYATYDISGKVINKQRKPIEGASVTVKGYRNTSMGEMVQTNEKGMFHITASDFPTDTINIVVSTPNAIDSVQHKTSYKKEKEGRGFYRGECEIETTIKLKQ